jgi:hypothetical protein
VLLKAQYDDVNEISHGNKKRGPAAAGVQRSAKIHQKKNKINIEEQNQNQKETRMERGIRIPPLFLCTQSRVRRSVWGLGSSSSSRFYTALLRGKKTEKKQRPVSFAKLNPPTINK